MQNWFIAFAKMFKIYINSLILGIQFQLILGRCSVNLQQHLNRRDPVFFQYNGTHYDLWSPNGPSLDWQTGDFNLIACTGSGNSLTINTQVQNNITCSEDTIFVLNEIGRVQSVELECRTTVSGDTINSGQPCGRGGTLILIGFNLGSRGFITYIQSCFNMVTASVIFTRHIIPGRAAAFSMVESSRPSFKTAGMPSHVSPAVSYTQASQLSRFTHLLDSAALAETYIRPNSFLARGHLSPDGDGIFRSWQFTTYFFTNAAPKWQVVNNGNWLRVERIARDVSIQYQEDMLIFQGAYDILHLQHRNGTLVPMSLEDGGIQVPKWFWKIIKSNQMDAGIAFVVLNNPFVTSLRPDEYVCNNVCDVHGWQAPQYLNFDRGYTYCCTIADLMNTIPDLPSEARATHVLNNV